MPAHQCLHGGHERRTNAIYGDYRAKMKLTAKKKKNDLWFNTEQIKRGGHCPIIDRPSFKQIIFCASWFAR